MKKIFIMLSLFSIAFTSCDVDMPYPIDKVTRGVVIDVSRIAGTDGVLADGLTTGNYRIKMTIPPEQGDYSFMKCAQLLAVLEDASGTTSAVVIDDITNFPQEFTLNIGEVYSKFGKSSPSLGETLYFTANVVKDDGSVIPGWTSYTGFNNVMFAGWIIEGRAFSNRVRYAVACNLDKDPNDGTFIGTFICDETSPYGDDSYEVTLSFNPGLPPTIPAGVTAANLVGIDITPFSPNVWEPTYEVVTIWINTEDQTLIIPDQDSGDIYQGNPNNKILWYNFRSMTVNTCTRTIQFTTQPYIPGVGGWSAFTFTIHP